MRRRFIATHVLFQRRSCAPSEPTRCPIMGTVRTTSCPVEEFPWTTKTATTLALGKYRLSAFVTATAAAGYVVAGGSSPAALLLLSVGTQLQGMSANTANQVIEAPYDAQMKRTRWRPIPTRRISEGRAVALCAAELAAGTLALGVVSPPAALMGVANWMLYVGVYTPLKRVSPTNTWVGTVVGAVPPLMGGIAATGSLLAPPCAPAVILGGAMFGWQVVHFMALSFHCREDYASAGYCMHALSHPWRARAYAVVSCLALTAVTLGGPFAVGWVPREFVWYGPLMACANAMLLMKACRFYQSPVQSCRGCFVASYVYLAGVLALLVVAHTEPLRRSVALYHWCAAGDGTLHRRTEV